MLPTRGLPQDCSSHRSHIQCSFQQKRSRHRHRGRAQPLLLSLLSVTFALGLPRCQGDFFNQIFTYSCPSSPLTNSPDPKDYWRWSDPKTWQTLSWGGRISPGLIPGVGAGINRAVTIPCGVRVLLDVTQLNLTLLDIRGFLKVEDPPVRRRNYQVYATYVTVAGQLQIGAWAQHFRSKITFTLLPNGKSRTPLTVTGLAFADKTSLVNPMRTTANVGHKAFAVVGGQLRLFGMPGGRDTPSWVRLRRTAMEGSDTIQVNSNVAGLWPVGGKIAISSTDYEWNNAEDFSIVSVQPTPDGKGSIIKLDGNLTNRHFGGWVSDGMGGFVDERGEVGLLTRNIVITGAVEPEPYLLEGGHFIVHQTRTPQAIEGVEFWRLGQQGTLGRYNIHFHVCADTRGLSSVYKNSIHDSNQRCVVVHATHNLTVEGTVAYNTSGHCFLLEEGGEMDNTFLNNLVILTRPVKKAISTAETDKEPASYWLGSIRNNWIGNVAAGSANSGFWTELRGRVRGMSAFITDLADIRPLFASPGGRFDSNVVHSCKGHGFRAYPHGIRGTKNGYDYNGYNTVVEAMVPFTITRFLAWKNPRMGIFVQASGKVIITGSTFADNTQGVYIQGNTAGRIEFNRFVGWTTNTGTPPPVWACARNYGPKICAPVRGCEFPPTEEDNIRALPGVHWKARISGIFVRGIDFFTSQSPVAQIRNNTFALFNPTCRPAAGVTMEPTGQWVDTAMAVRGSVNAPGSLPVWLPPQEDLKDPNTGNIEKIIPAYQYDMAVRDPDGAVVGGNGGYLVTNNSFTLPPRIPGQPFPCSMRPRANAWACPGTCYRTVAFRYRETGSRAGGNEDKEDSYLFLKRAVDGEQREVLGWSTSGSNRQFVFTVLSGQVYDVFIKPGPRSKSFWPEELTVFFMDGWGLDEPCPGRVDFRIMPRGNSRQWEVQHDKGVFFSPCPGVSFTARSALWPVLYQYACYNNQRILYLRLTPRFPSRRFVVLTPTGGAIAPCSKPIKCGIVADEDWYMFEDSGRDFHSKAGNRVQGYQSLFFKQKGWTYGRAPIGNDGDSGRIKLNTVAKSGTKWEGDNKIRTTFYFRRWFTVTWLRCFSGIYFEYYGGQGYAFYINGVEAFRTDLPSGRLNYSMEATTDTPTTLYSGELLTTKFIPLFKTKKQKGRPWLRNGANLLAVEVHLRRDEGKWAFDSTMALEYTCT